MALYLFEFSSYLHQDVCIIIISEPSLNVMKQQSVFIWGYSFHSSNFRWESREALSHPDMALTTWYICARGILQSLSHVRWSSQSQLVIYTTVQQGGGLWAQVAHGNVIGVSSGNRQSPSSVRLEQEGRAGRCLVFPAWTLSDLVGFAAPPN